MKFEASTTLPTEYGTFNVHIFTNTQQQEITAICHGQLSQQQQVVARLHSACFTSEVLHSLKCDCKQQFDHALRYIAIHNGIIIYLPQEGRGIGLVNKIRAYALQEQGYDTIEANQQLGLPIDSRTYEDAAFILSYLQIKSVQLLTNNPEKLSKLADLGVEVTGRIPVPVIANNHSIQYLQTKQQQMGHMLTIQQNIPISTKKGIITRPQIHVDFALDQQGQLLLQSPALNTERQHQLLQTQDAIAIGGQRFFSEQPALTIPQAAQQPDRVIFSSQPISHISDPSTVRRTFIVSAQIIDQPNTLSILSQQQQLAEPLQQLYQQGIKKLLVIGGKQLITSFLAQGYVDCISLYVDQADFVRAIHAVQQHFPLFSSDQLAISRLGSGCLIQYVQ